MFECKKKKKSGSQVGFKLVGEALIVSVGPIQRFLANPPDPSGPMRSFLFWTACPSMLLLALLQLAALELIKSQGQRSLRGGHGRRGRAMVWDTPS